MKKVLLIGSQHGDELLGEKLYAYIAEHHPEMLKNVDFLVGNPRARKLRVRFIESDLNRSFNGKTDTYEERRARRISKYIAMGGYELVLDLHTTTCKQPPCLITETVNHPYICASAIKHVVHMNHDIVRTSLIGVCREAISLEVSRDESSHNETLAVLCDDIMRFLRSEPSGIAKKVYQVDSLLQKSEVTEAEITSLRNFHRTKGGFYPVLVGEKAYRKHTDYLGFKAHHVYEVR